MPDEEEEEDKQIMSMKFCLLFVLRGISEEQ
jgi:hypothetical protein